MPEIKRAFPGVGGPNLSKRVPAPLSKAPLSKDKGKGRLRQRLALFLTGAGALLLLYVSFQYWQMYDGQRKLAQQWQLENASPENIVAVDPDALVRLTIPRINLDAVVVKGTSRASLKLGPGHMEASALPGSPGNSVIVAHRDTFFRHLDELQENDEIDLQRQGAVYRFEVTGRRIVEPTDLSPLQEASAAQLTLITCYPMHFIGPAPKRLVVVARLMATPEAAQR
jgi:LPXTG-site transpeptidase (sortase) family protein